MRLNKRHKRRITIREKIKAGLRWALRLASSRRTPSKREIPQWERDLAKMTNWQNSQWLRAGARRDNTAKFLNMPRRRVSV